MSPDYLAAITAYADAWEAALALLWHRVNAFLAREGGNAKLPVNPVPADGAWLTDERALFDAISKLKVAAHNMRAFHPMRENPCVLCVNEQMAFPIAHPAEVDSHLQQIADISAKAGIADPWTCNIVEPNKKHAEAVRAWLAAERANAVAKSLDEKDKEILQALELLRAFDENTLRTAEEIAAKVEGQGADPQAYKKRLSELANKKRLLDSKGGRGGGSWLNPLGRAVISFIHSV